MNRREEIEKELKRNYLNCHIEVKDDEFNHYIIHLVLNNIDGYVNINYIYRNEDSFLQNLEEIIYELNSNIVRLFYKGDL